MEKRLCDCIGAFLLSWCHRTGNAYSWAQGRDFEAHRPKKEPTWHNMRKGQEPQEEGV